MQFEEGHLYHIYNQGNNRQKIFFSRENYLFFLRKIREYILPHADVVAWCLMPNHFHLMVYVRTVEIEIENLSAPIEGVTHAFIEGVTQSDALNKSNAPHKSISDALNKSNAPNNHPPKRRTLNDSIGLLQRSYTRAINKQENSTGSLFRKECKSLCLTSSVGLSPSYFDTAFGANIYIPAAEKEYPQICFNYIHQNPVIARLVEKSEEWEFSSYPDYVGLRDGQLISRERAEEFVQFNLVFDSTISVTQPLKYPKTPDEITAKRTVDY